MGVQIHTFEISAIKVYRADRFERHTLSLASRHRQKPKLIAEAGIARSFHAITMSRNLWFAGLRYRYEENNSHRPILKKYLLRIKHAQHTNNVQTNLHCRFQPL